MADQHPLTAEICIDLMSDHWGNGGLIMDMRAAADWQLEQVIEWLKDSLQEHKYSGIGIDVDWVIEDIQKELRPQEDN